MIEKNNTPVDAAAGATAGRRDARSDNRREFLVKVGRKAVYLPPLVLSLSATPAFASPHSASCKPLGGSCDSNDDCCSNNCNSGVCI